jgi:protoporphyrinogen oxidase
MTRAETWGIVGGGFLGMTLAHRLRQQGNDVTLFEGASYLGGLASAWKLGNVVWDRHYHVTLLSDTYLRSLLAELDLAKEMQWVETRTGFYTDGRLYSMSNTLEFLRFPPISILSKLRLGATIFYASKLTDWKRLEKISVIDWLTRWSGARTVEKIWLPLLRAKLGENYRKASAAFIWACIARMYAARRTGLKKEMFGYVPGGYAQILERFSEHLAKEGVHIKLRHTAKTVQSLNGNGVSIDFENGRRETFDHIVLTIPAPVAVRLCPQLSEDEKSRLMNIEYQGIICASVLLKKPLADFYVTNITDSWVPFTAVIEMSALVDRKYFHGNTLVYLPKYVVPDDPAFDLSDRQIEERFVEALTKMYPHFERGDILCFRVSRVKYVLALSTLNYSDHLPPMTTSINGVHIANSAHICHGTLNVNETIQLAETTAKTLMALSRSGELVSIDHVKSAKAHSQPVIGP